MIYYYFDSNGRLQETVSGNVTAGSSDVDAVSVYWDNPTFLVEGITATITFYRAGGGKIGVEASGTFVTGQVPESDDRDYSRFEEYVDYRFARFDVQDAVLAESGAVVAAVRVFDASGTEVKALSDATFMVNGSYVYDDSISRSQYDYITATLDGKQAALSEDEMAAADSGITAAKVASYDDHISDTSNPHGVTKAQVGLGSVENVALSAWKGSENLSDTAVGTLAAAATRGVDANIGEGTQSANLPTSKAVEDRINAHAGIDRVGTVTSVSVSMNGEARGTVTGSGTIDLGTVITDVSGKADLVDGKVPASQLPSYVDSVVEYDTLADFPATGETGKIYVAKDTNRTYRWGGSGYVEISSSLALGETASTAYPGDKGKANADAIKTKAEKSTTLAGYGITDAYTKAQADAQYVLYVDDDGYVCCEYGNLTSH